MGADDHAGHTVIDAGRRLVDPDRLAGPAAGEVLEEIEGAGQDVVGRDRLQRRQVEALEKLAQARLAGAAAILAGKQVGAVAGVEEDHAALLEVALDALDRLRREVRMVGRDGPVEEREEGELGRGNVDRGGVGGLDRRALGQDAGKAAQARLALLVHGRIAGHDIGEPGLVRELDQAVLAFLGLRRGQPEEEGHGSGRGSDRAGGPARAGSSR